MDNNSSDAFVLIKKWPHKYNNAFILLVKAKLLR